MSVSFTNIYVYWILNFVSLLTVSYFADLHGSITVMTFIHGKIFLLSDIINGMEMSEQIIYIIIFYLFIYFIPSIVTLASHLAGFQFSFLICGYPLL